jgi:hypothetical protein
LTKPEPVSRSRVFGMHPIIAFGSRQPTAWFSERNDTIASADDITREIAVLKDRLSILDRERSEIANRLGVLEHAQIGQATRQPQRPASRVTSASPTAQKIALFHDLFRGREEVFPRRWENARSGQAGYSPVCRNEWVRGVCRKPEVKCGECPSQAFVPFGDDVLRSHLIGKSAGNSIDFTAGIYPMLPDETCWFLVIAHLG